MQYLTTKFNIPHNLMQSQAYISNRQFPGSKEQLLNAMLSAFSEMVYLYDAVENRVIFISDNLTEILGYADGKFFTGNRDVRSLIHQDDLAEISAATKRLFKKSKPGATVKCNVRIKHVSGLYKWFSIRQVIFSYAPEGKLVKYIFGVAVDINERKQAEERVRAQNAAIGRYVFTASHTLRAPLANILAITRLFNELPDDNVEEYRQWAAALNVQAQILDGIVHEMITSISK